MPGARNSLLQEGLAVLADLLPAGFSVGKSSLARRPQSGKGWIILRGGRDRTVTCLVLARARIEKRDFAALALIAAGTARPVLVVSGVLSAAARRRLPELGIGCWDLAGSARIEMPSLGLCLECDGAPAARARTDRGLRSLSGPMAGRVVRALVDLRPPQTIASLAAQTGVDASYVSRVLAFVEDAGWLERRTRGRLVGVDWQPLLRRWAREAPLATRGELCHFHCPHTVSDFLARLARSGFLHALTGLSAYRALAAIPTVETAMLYVEDVAAAVAQFGLRAASGPAELLLIRGADRDVFHRSREQGSLRYVSASLMAADLGEPDALDAAVDWMASHEAVWRG